jgi:hypothetical protein
MLSNHMAHDDFYMGLETAFIGYNKSDFGAGIQCFTRRIQTSPICFVLSPTMTGCHKPSRSVVLSHSCASGRSKPVTPDTGAKQRMDMLKNDAARKILDPLATHGWSAQIERTVEGGDYLIIKAERGGQQYKVGFLYTSATDNRIYQSLAREVEYIFFNGQPYMVESFARGIDKPVGPVDDFHALLHAWNAASGSGKFAPIDDPEEEPFVRAEHRLLLSEQPIEAIWLRLHQLQSVTLAKRLIVERAGLEGAILEERVVRSKAEGLAYTLRNTSDYYQARDVRNVSQRVLNLYYGSMSFAFAEMLAAPQGPTTLTEIENSTKQGHGLYTIDGAGDGLDGLVVGIIQSGFYPAWLRAIGLHGDAIPSRKPRNFDELPSLPEGSWHTLGELFGTIPEIGDLFQDVLDLPPRWVSPSFDQEASHWPNLMSPPTKKSTRAYAILSDASGRLTKEDIAKFPGPISDISALPPKAGMRRFRIAIDHHGHDVWWQALTLHHSPFNRQALLLPVFGSVDAYRAICIALLYALSIVVRYRPGLWRRVQEGDLDHMRVMIEAFLAVVERILPEQFLERITAQRIFAKQPGSFF